MVSLDAAEPLSTLHRQAGSVARLPPPQQPRRDCLDAAAVVLVDIDFRLRTRHRHVYGQQSWRYS
jgi:hypothetical protein